MKKNCTVLLLIFFVTFIDISSTVRAYDNEFHLIIIVGNSMSPTLNDGDIIVCKRKKQIEDKDIIVCNTERIYLDSELIIKRYIKEKSKKGYYLEGDNKEESFDSRNFGLLPKSSYEYTAILRISFFPIFNIQSL